jgi:hypothetical protein
MVSSLFTDPCPCIMPPEHPPPPLCPYTPSLADGVNYANASTIPYVGSLPVSSAGTITFSAAAIDNSGAVTPSNPLTVTVAAGSSGGGGGGSTWTLSVQGGTGSGTWLQYTWVNVTANAAPAGQVFAGWSVACNGQCPALQFSDKASPSMQVYGRSAGAATLVATYKVGAKPGENQMHDARAVHVCVRVGGTYLCDNEQVEGGPNTR